MTDITSTPTGFLQDKAIYLILLMVGVLSTACVTPLSVRRHEDVTLSNNDADTILAEFSDVVSIADSEADFACAEGFNVLPLAEEAKPARYIRSGGVSTYNATADIASRADFDAVMATPGYVKVVNSITWCGGFGANIIGCAGIDTTSMAVVRWTAGNEGSLWAHEYGHTVGLPHRANGSAIMNATLTGTQDEVNAEECEAMVSRAVNHPLNNSGIVTGAGSAGSATAAREIEFPSSHHLEWKGDMDVIDFVSQTFIHGTPVELAEKFAGRKNEAILIEMLFDAEESEHWGNIVFTLGVMGGSDSVPHIIDWMDGMTETKMDWTDVRQISAGMMGLGYLAHRSDDSRALAYLSQSAYQGAQSRDFQQRAMETTIAKSATIGVAMVGSDKSLRVLGELQNLQDAKTSSAGFDALFELHKEVRDYGLRDHFVR